VRFRPPGDYAGEARCGSALICLTLHSWVPRSQNLQPRGANRKDSEPLLPPHCCLTGRSDARPLNFCAASINAAAAIVADWASTGRNVRQWNHARLAGANDQVAAFSDFTDT